MNGGYVVMSFAVMHDGWFLHRTLGTFLRPQGPQVTGTFCTNDTGLLVQLYTVLLWGYRTMNSIREAIRDRSGQKCTNIMQPLYDCTIVLHSQLLGRTCFWRFWTSCHCVVQACCARSAVRFLIDESECRTAAEARSK
jgi:hypothetical protein